MTCKLDGLDAPRAPVATNTEAQVGDLKINEVVRRVRRGNVSVGDRMGLKPCKISPHKAAKHAASVTSPETFLLIVGW